VVAVNWHFPTPTISLDMMPAWLPLKEAANLISGAAEITGGIGLLFPSLRRTAAWGLIALLVAVFPANVHVATPKPHDRPRRACMAALASPAVSSRLHRMGLVGRPRPGQARHPGPVISPSADF